jgi:hypothetical protein
VPDAIKLIVNSKCIKRIATVKNKPGKV